MCSPLRRSPRSCCYSLWQVLPAWFPVSSFPDPLSLNLFGNHSVSISLSPYPYEGSGVPANSSSSHLPVSALVACESFLGVVFLAAEPAESSAGKRARAPGVRNSACACLLLPHTEEGRCAFPSRVTRGLQGPAGQPAPGTAAAAVSTSHLGFLPRKGPAGRRRSPLEVTWALRICWLERLE